jgi:hypothetical protein
VLIFKPPPRLQKIAFFRHASAFLRRAVRSAISMDLVPKVKMLYAFCQIAAALPAVYGVSQTIVDNVWAATFDKIDLDFEAIFIPGICVGRSYVDKLSLYVWMPLLLMAVVLAAGAVKHLIAVRLHRYISHAPPAGAQAELANRLERMFFSGVSDHDHEKCGKVTNAGLMQALPLVLLIMFCLTPMISTKIFETYVRDEFMIGLDSNGDPIYKMYLAVDYRLAYDSEEYAQAHAAATFYAFIWPVGMPLFFLLVLFKARKSIIYRRPSALSTATKFLHKEYAPGYFWWEPVEMVRKMVLTGFLLVAVHNDEQFKRMIVATMISIISCCSSRSASPSSRRPTTTSASACT